MEVQIKFDTENDSLEDLKKLVAGLQDIIVRRGGAPVPVQQEQKPVEEKPIEQKPRYEQQAEQTKPMPGKTAGGCRVVQFEDISSAMNSFYTGKNY